MHPLHLARASRTGSRPPWSPCRPATRRPAPAAPLLAALLAAALVLPGCDSHPGAETALPAEIRITSLTRTPLAPGKDASEYVLALTAATPPDAGLPAGFYLLPREAGASGIAFTDDGAGADQVAGDGVFTAVVTADPFPQPESSGKAGKIEINCTVKFAAPGQECGSFGACPEESLLGGETLFCVCMEDCSIKVTFG